jgi:hypothetical protein
MGMYHSTYFAYGFQIPDTNPQRLEDADLGEGVGYLLAGDYDRDMTFLVTECIDVQLGDHRKVTPDSFQQPEIEAWNTALTEAAARLGVHTGFEPGWFVVPDLS